MKRWPFSCISCLVGVNLLTEKGQTDDLATKNLHESLDFRIFAPIKCVRYEVSYRHPRFWEDTSWGLRLCGQDTADVEDDFWGQLLFSVPSAAFRQVTHGKYLFKLLGLYVDVERHTTDGRMDILVETKDYVYILELKMDQSADVALQQIEDKQYAKPFEGDGRTIYKIGVSFSSETRRLVEWKIR